MMGPKVPASLPGPAEKGLCPSLQVMSTFQAERQACMHAIEDAAQVSKWAQAPSSHIAQY